MDGRPRNTPADPALAELLVDGVDDELADVDQRQMIVERDELLVELLELKRRRSHLP